MMGKNFKIGLLGRGTVGGAFADLLKQRAPSIERATGIKFEIVGTLSRDSGDFDEILGASDAIVELIGGIDPARAYVTRALESGRHVVTANKQLISRYCDELVSVAGGSEAQLRFEAAVAGVIPVVRVIRESLAGSHLEKVHGIVNGTTNYILSEMASSGADYSTALKQAQDLGYAEADPHEDVSGLDAAAKMAILARLAFHAPVHLDDVSCEGIEEIKPDDISYAKEFGLVLKLLGVAERIDAGMSVRVFPCFLYRGHPLATVNGPFNAVMVESEAITEITMSGPGAGGTETATAVLGDVVSVATADVQVPEQVESLELVPAGEVESAFYLHMDVEDRPGVLARIAEILGDGGVSVKSVFQRGLGENARLVMVTHSIAEKQFWSALDRIAKLDDLRSPPRAIRVIEEEFG